MGPTFAERLGQVGREPRAFTILRRLVLAFLAVHVTLALISGYRAIVQVYRVDVRVPANPLGAGAVVDARVVTSGRAEARLELALVQGAHAEPLGERRLPRNGDGAYDPRPRRESLAVALTPALLARFRAGPAIVRATGHGSAQWLRVPPPVVREAPIVLVTP